MAYDWNWTERERRGASALIDATNERGDMEGYLRLLALVARHLGADHGISLARAAEMISEREG